MILLLNLRLLHLHTPRGKPWLSALYESHMRLGRCPRVTLYSGVFIHVSVCINACTQMRLGTSAALSADKHSPAAVTAATPPDTENEGKVMENYLHKTAQCTISQTPEPEGA